MNVPAFDEWRLVRLERHRREGSMGFGELFSQHNEHRLFFPRILMLAVGNLTHFDSIALMITGWLFLIVTSTALFWEHLHVFGRSARSVALFLPVQWMVFTLAQWENLLWGWQVQIFELCTTFVGALLFATYGKSKRAIALGVACAIVCTYSFASGAIVWPIVIGVAIARRQKVAALVFGAFAVVAVSAYAHGYRKPPWHPSTTHALHNPLDGVLYFLTNLGGSLWFDEGGARVMATVLIVLFVVVVAIAIRARRREVFLFPAGLVALAIGMGVLLTAGRSGISISQAFSSRYTTITILGVIGLYRGALALEPHRARVALAAGVAVLALFGTTVSSYEALDTAKKLQVQRAAGARALREWRTSPDAEIARIHVAVDVVRDDAPFLEENRLSVFADP